MLDQCLLLSEWDRTQWPVKFGLNFGLGVNLGKLWEMMGDREAWHAAAHGGTKNQTQLGD